jgi:hypothetical protein
MIACSSNFGVPGVEKARKKGSSAMNFLIDKKLIQDLPKADSRISTLENKASIDDLISIQRLCKRGVSKEEIVKQFKVKYKVPDIEKYIERCMK